MKLQDLTGQTFGYWTVIEQDLNKKKTYWICQCKCGKIKSVRADILKNGQSISCGCSTQEDITGQRFGKLIAQKLEYRIGNNYYWNCKCDCGNKTIVLKQNLKKGHTSSCGCLNSSTGEYKIKDLLLTNNISFETQKTFNTCRFIGTEGLARFDFYVDNKYLIEYDGVQHFKETGGWNTKEHFTLIKEHDNYKNQWCRDNNIPLIRIPYTHYNNLCLNDLLLETSQFRVC